ncbi:hypothetical protein H5410_058868 [Solanum commersonii]|uniref:Uncharacterized protein n=1 Tax=Solanum commersonii TaxID=4109 RepID=A0A9J5W1S1_SOLCO|nr:hypothetical protein H5410_058868 [Solanum commersonii]
MHIFELYFNPTVTPVAGNFSNFREHSPQIQEMESDKGSHTNTQPGTKASNSFTKSQMLTYNIIRLNSWKINGNRITKQSKGKF